MPNRAVTTLVTACLLLASCSSPDSATPGPAFDVIITADQVVATLTTKIPTVKFVKTYTADTDPNHMLGRPNGYISKTAFADSRIPADQLDGVAPDGTNRGGSVEVFPDGIGAKARADYIQAFAKSLPAAAEYDYLAGAVLVRVSRLLTPDQAKGFEAAIK